MEDGWHIFITLVGPGMKSFPFRLLFNLTLTESSVLKSKIIRGAKSFELLRDMISKKIEAINVEVHEKPQWLNITRIGWCKIMILTDEGLDRSRVEYIKFVEAQLRKKWHINDKECNNFYMLTA